MIPPPKGVGYRSLACTRVRARGRAGSDGKRRLRAVASRRDRAVVGFISDTPGASFQRQTWQTASTPVRQLLEGRTFTLDTGSRQETRPDQELSGRVSVQFRPAAVR